MFFLRQSTATTVKIGPFLDETDGITAETGLTISQADVRLTKNGANIAHKNNANAATHDELGWYNCNLDATDTNTLGRLQLMVHESGALPVWHEYQVVTANTWDTLCGADAWDVTVDTIDAGSIDSIWDEVMESTFTARQMMMVFQSVLAGKSTGGGTNTQSFRDIDDGKNRVVATTDANHNRTAITLDVT